MDYTRWDTRQAMAAGVLNRPAPSTDIPVNRERYKTDSYALSARAIKKALADGKLVHQNEYYGLVYAWKDDAGYHGRLLQYRSVTEAPDFTSAKATTDWFIDTARSVIG